MNVGAMSVSRSVNAVSAIPAVNSIRDIIYFPRNSRVMFHEKDICPPCDKSTIYHELK